MCNIEFPHFGASYPDAHCINGYLWDMDSYENGCYTIGGDDPCPFCNTEAWLKTVLDNEEFASREEALEWVEKMREKWGTEHLADTRKTSPKDLEEAAEDFGKRQGLELRPFANKFFIAGAKWDREQMMNETVEGWVAVDSDTDGKRRVTFFPKEPVRDVLTKYKYWAATHPRYESIKLDSNAFPNLKWEDEPKKVKLIIVKEDEK